MFIAPKKPYMYRLVFWVGVSPKTYPKYKPSWTSSFVTLSKLRVVSNKTDPVISWKKQYPNPPGVVPPWFWRKLRLVKKLSNSTQMDGSGQPEWFKQSFGKFYQQLVPKVTFYPEAYNPKQSLQTSFFNSNRAYLFASFSLPNLRKRGQLMQDVFHQQSPVACAIVGYWCRNVATVVTDSANG